MTRERPTALLLDLDGVLRRFDPEVGAEIERRYGLPAGVLAGTALRWPLLQPAVTGRISHEQWLDAVAGELAGAGVVGGPAVVDGPDDPLWRGFWGDPATGAVAAHDSGRARTREVRLDPVAGHPAPQPQNADARTAGVAGDLVAARKAVAEWAAHRGEVDSNVLAFVREVRAAGRPVGLATNSTDALDADLAGLGLVGEFDVVVNSAIIGVHKPAKGYFAKACLAVGASPAQVLFVDDQDRSVRGARVAGLSAYRWNGPEDLRYLRAALAL